MESSKVPGQVQRRVIKVPGESAGMRAVSTDLVWAAARVAQTAGETAAHSDEILVDNLAGYWVAASADAKAGSMVAAWVAAWAVARAEQ